jgi:hypothetical protein
LISDGLILALEYRLKGIEGQEMPEISKQQAKQTLLTSKMQF